MLRAVCRRGDPMPGVARKPEMEQLPDGILKERLRHMLPPLYPAHCLRRGELVFSAGETDPAFYILASGTILISHSFLLRPRSGFSASHDRTAGRELSLGLHRLQTGESFGETELLESAAADVALPRASTATCASTACELLTIPSHLFQLLSDVFDGLHEPIKEQAEERCKGLVWSWVSALATHGTDSGHACRKTMEPNDVAWTNKLYSTNVPFANSAPPNPSCITKSAPVQPGHRRAIPLAVKTTSREDQFIVVEDGVVEVVILDTRTGKNHSHILWPKDFVYCNQRPGAHPLDALGEFSSTIIVELKPVTPSQLTFVHGDVFSQAINQPSMQLASVYLVERFRTPPNSDPSPHNNGK